MCAFIVGAFLLSVLLVGVFHGEFGWLAILVLAVLALSAFGRSSDQERKRKLTKEQLEYYEKKNRENTNGEEN